MSINDIAQEKEQLARYIAAMQASLSQKKARGIVEQFCQSWPSYDRTSFWKEVERSNEVDWTAAGMNRFQVSVMMTSLKVHQAINSAHLDMSAIKVDDPSVVYSLLAGELSCQKVEKFVVVGLDIKHRVIDLEVISVGTRSESLADPKLVFGAAMKMNADRIIVAHNHPTGDLTPSTNDIQLTKDLIAAGQVLNTFVIDHLILGDNTYNSLRSSTDLWVGVPLAA